MRARGRMLSWKISIDRAVGDLSCDSARLLFTWMIAHADNLGRLRGDPSWVREEVMPLIRSARPRRVGKWLDEMKNLELIDYYEVDGIKYVQFRKWDKHQKLTGNMRKHGDLPAPPQYEVREEPPRRTDGVSAEVEVGSGERKKEERNRCSRSARPQAEENRPEEPALNLPPLLPGTPIPSSQERSVPLSQAELDAKAQEQIAEAVRLGLVRRVGNGFESP